MKTVVGFLIFVSIVVGFTSCQKEIDWGLNNNPQSDTTPHLIFRIVDIDPLSTPQDSIIRVYRTATLNNEHVILGIEYYTGVTNDSLINIYRYNSQGQLIEIKTAAGSAPNIVLFKSTFTWNGNRMIKAQSDTMGVFEMSVDLAYTALGANTVITPTYIPTQDINTPNYASGFRQSLTVNNQFVPVSRSYNAYGIIDNGGGNWDHYHDTANFQYTFTGNDLSSMQYFSSRHDTVNGPIVTIDRDTTHYTYNRSSAGINIADSLKKIIGNEIYTLINFEVLIGGYIPVIVSGRQETLHYFFRPLSMSSVTRRFWVNGVFDPGQSLNNLPYQKADNSFDAQQRATRFDLYSDFSTTRIENIIKITY